MSRLVMMLQHRSHPSSCELLVRSFIGQNGQGCSAGRSAGRLRQQLKLRHVLAA